MIILVQCQCCMIMIKISYSSILIVPFDNLANLCEYFVSNFTVKMSSMKYNREFSPLNWSEPKEKVIIKCPQNGPYHD